MTKGRLTVPEKSPLIIAAIACVAAHWLCQFFTIDYFGNPCVQIPYISEVSMVFTIFDNFIGSAYRFITLPIIINVALRLAFAILLLVGVIKAHKTLKPLIAAWVVLAVNPLLVWITTAIVVLGCDFGEKGFELMAAYISISALDIVLTIILAGAIAMLLILIGKGILRNKIALIAVVIVLFAADYFPVLYSCPTEGVYWLFAIKLCVGLCAFAPTVLVAISMKNGCVTQKENLEFGEQNAVS